MDFALVLVKMLEIMTKLILLACAITCISYSAAVCQSQPKQERDSASQTPYENKDSRFYQNDMIKLKPSEIPEAIKQTLKNDEFKGWESGTMFKSPDGQVYLLQMGKGDKARVYRFDPNGKSVRGN